MANGSGEVEVESLASDTTINTLPASTVQSQPLESVVIAPSVVAPPAIAPPVAVPTLDSGDNKVYLQLGAFESRENAEAFLERMRGQLNGSGKELKLTSNGGLVRVHIGPYASESEARKSADRLEDKLGFKPMVNLP